jgi:cobalt-zinc-cadmium efflux system protein
MPHTHIQSASHTHGAENTRSLRTAFFLNLGFTLLELLGGLWTNSLAILSDALHDLGDSFSLGMAWYLERYAQKPHDVNFSYGYRRFSLLGALFNSLVLIAGAIVVITQAIPRLVSPQQPHASGMAVFALVGIVVNGAAVLRLRHQQSANAQVVLWHLLEDVLGWVAVLIVSIVMLFKDLPILDPIISMLITLYVLVNVTGKLKKTVTLFLQAVPPDINLCELIRRIQTLEPVRSVHHTHVWSLDAEHHVLTTHVVLKEHDGWPDALRVKQQIRESIRPIGFEHTTIEIEYSDELCQVHEPHLSGETASGPDEV